MLNTSVTILLAAYKGSAYAGAQIESILAQDYEDWTLILSDDGEDTAPLLEAYAARYPEKIRHHRSGLRFGSAQKHFMYLISRFGQEAPYTMCCDQDDVWHPDKIRKTLTAMKRAEMGRGVGIPVLVHTDLRVVDGNLNELDPSFMHFSKIDGNRLAFHQLLVQNVVTGCTMMFNRPLALLTARAEGTEAMMMHDWWMALVAAALGKAVFLPEATINYRQHEKNVVGAKNAGSFAHMASRLKGDYIRRMRNESISQAEAFADCYAADLPEAEREVLKAFIALKEQSKAEKIKTIEQYGFWKNTLSRRVGQLWKW